MNRSKYGSDKFSNRILSSEKQQYNCYSSYTFLERDTFGSVILELKFKEN